MKIEIPKKISKKIEEKVKDYFIKKTNDSKSDTKRIRINSK